MAKKKALLRSNAKKKGKRRKRTMYICRSKIEQSRNFLFEVQNEHGAWDDKHIAKTVYILTFGYDIPLQRYRSDGEMPEVVHAHMEYATTNKETADKYAVGQEYADLPK